jgi:hypothetical protein
MSTFSLLISPPDALQPGFTESTLCMLYSSVPEYKYTASYITERSATTHIAMHPELRLVV